LHVCAVYFDLATLDSIFIQSGLIVDADEDGDTILGYLDSGLGGDLLRNYWVSGIEIIADTLLTS
jgi:hypothetical protein